MEKAAFSSHPKLFALLLSTCLLVGFITFSYLVHKNLFTHFDFDMTVRLQDHMSRRFDGFFSFLSDIGKVEIVSIFLIGVLLVYRKWKAFFVLVFFGVLHFIEIYGKTFVQHRPPPHFMLRTHDIFSFPQFYVEETNSYPSGHAGRALFVTVFLSLIIAKTHKLQRTQKILIYCALGLYDIVMVISRVYLGEHWTSDVIGGSLLGAALGLLSWVVL